MTAEVDAQVIVIGAGPSGAVVAHTLAAAGISVTCLEQGDWVSPSDYPANHPMWELVARTYWNPEPNHRHNPADYPLELSESGLKPGMYSAVGGSSIHFGGVWPRLVPADFRVASVDGVADDWPVSYDELAPFFDETDQMLGVAGLDGDPAYPEGLAYPQPPHPLGKAGLRAAAALNELGWHWWPGPNSIPTAGHKDLAPCARWGTCGQGCPEGAKASFDLAYWPEAIRNGAKLVTGARVNEITVDADGLATGARWLDRDGVEHSTTSKYVVVCANAIGTARLLLLSTSPQHPRGLANSSDLVGRNLMLHPTCAVYGYYTDDDLETWRGPVGALINSLEFCGTPADRAFLRGFKLEVSSAPGLIAAGVEAHRDLPFDELWGSNIHCVLDEARNTMRWFAVVEDLPDPSNRVTLDDEITDDLGVPIPRISYTISENTLRIRDFALQRMTQAHEAAGAARIVQMPTLDGDPGHLLGTARMGSDPATSVVNAYGRAHDVPNLFIADGSTFVTGGSVNPTSTIVALALRSARHLAEQITSEQVVGISVHEVVS